MKKSILYFLAIAIATVCLSQIDKDQLALSVAKAEDANLTKLKDYIWKRNSNVFLEDVNKLSTTTAFSFNEEGELEAKIVDAETSVQKKRGLRGAAQQNAINDKADYIEKAFGLSLAYTFMTKGDLIDYFGKATITEKDGLLITEAMDVKIKGDRLTMHIDKKTNLILYKDFSSLLGADKVEGKFSYENFENGTVHGSSSTMLLPAKKMRIESVNQDYTVRVK